jgi:hypothetical protein
VVAPVVGRAALGHTLRQAQAAGVVVIDHLVRVVQPSAAAVPA